MDGDRRALIEGKKSFPYIIVIFKNRLGAEIYYLATEKGKVVFMLHCKKYGASCFLCVTCFPLRFPACADYLAFTVVIATISYTVTYNHLQDFQRNGDDTSTLF